MANSPKSSEFKLFGFYSSFGALCLFRLSGSVTKGASCSMYLGCRAVATLLSLSTNIGPCSWPKQHSITASHLKESSMRPTVDKCCVAIQTFAVAGAPSHFFGMSSEGSEIHTAGCVRRGRYASGGTQHCLDDDILATTSFAIAPDIFLCHVHVFSVLMFLALAICGKSTPFPSASSAAARPKAGTALAGSAISSKGSDLCSTVVAPRTLGQDC